MPSQNCAVIVGMHSLFIICQGLRPFFLSVRRTVSDTMCFTIPAVTNCLASNSSVQRFRPVGGLRQANAIKYAAFSFGSGCRCGLPSSALYSSGSACGARSVHWCRELGRFLGNRNPLAPQMLETFSLDASQPVVFLYTALSPR